MQTTFGERGRENAPTTFVLALSLPERIFQCPASINYTQKLSLCQNISKREREKLNAYANIPLSPLEFLTRS